ncbi:helix-turn-helix transcriptional regulator [uncultured Roseibium sp.]|uniref:AraC family transcriptional regulator n=1 Tax=uncultured Roseibium sp. TaxID=1936171 RepID=UPI00259AD451|nr:helix-turn-helix transcriptional regulator [uncultured Roseibium sp.]
MVIHPDLFDVPGRTLGQVMTGFARTQVRGTENRWHSHEEGQLFHVIHGAAAVDTELGTFHAPPERALWIPPKVAHHARYLSETEIRFLYVSPEAASALPDRPQVIQVTQLLRELILEFMSFGRGETQEGPAARIAAVILDQLKVLPAAPLQLPMPTEKRLRTVCERIVRCPADIPPLTAAAEACATSVRSFERRMKSETGLSYRTWCRQVKLFRALEMLAEGSGVSEVSHRLGYEGPSAFVATFKKAFGVTPGRYFT